MDHKQQSTNSEAATRFLGVSSSPPTDLNLNDFNDVMEKLRQAGGRYLNTSDKSLSLIHTRIE